MNQFERTLEALSSTTRAGFEAKIETVSFLKQFKWDQLTPVQLLKVLEIIKES